MEFHYDILEECAEEIDQAIIYYESEFSSGVSDFLTCFDDTINRILLRPSAGRRLSAEEPTLRSMPLEAKKGRKIYAKSFPYLIFYQVVDDQNKVILFQLWPIKSNQEKRKPE